LIKSGFEQASVVARFQKITVGDKQVILDVAHNSAAVEKLVDTLQASEAKTVAIFSALADKNIDDMIDLAKDTFTHWFLVPLDVERAIQIELLQAKFDASLTTTVCQGMSSAIDSALALENTQRIVIFGSFHTITDATLILREN
jgi:dihydrofolate synthase/folylpolyglutamate synthase